MKFKFFFFLVQSNISIQFEQRKSTNLREGGNRKINKNFSLMNKIKINFVIFIVISIIIKSREKMHTHTHMHTQAHKDCFC